MIELSDLTKIFIGSLEHTDFANPDFCIEKLERYNWESRAQPKHIILLFVALYGKNKMQSFIVYKFDIDLNSTIGTTYQLLTWRTKQVSIWGMWFLTISPSQKSCSGRQQLKIWD